MRGAVASGQSIEHGQSRRGFSLRRGQPARHPESCLGRGCDPALSTVDRDMCDRRGDWRNTRHSSCGHSDHPRMGPRNNQALRSPRRDRGTRKSRRARVVRPGRQSSELLRHLRRRRLHTRRAAFRRHRFIVGRQRSSANSRYPRRGRYRFSISPGARAQSAARRP